MAAHGAGTSPTHSVLAVGARLGWLSSTALCALALGGCHRPPPPRAGASTAARAAAEPAGDVVLTLLATSEVRGTPEPCGCQSDPLGDIARVATLLTEAQAGGPALLVDAGGLRYGVTHPGALQWAQVAMKADFLEEQWAALGAVVGLGDEDLLEGPERVPAGRRLCANLAGLPVAPSQLRTLGGLTVGVFAVIDPALLEPAAERAGKRPGAPPLPLAGLSAGDPVAAARREVAALRGRGAQVVVGLLHMARPAARALVRAVPGITVAVAGDEVGDDGAQTERVGESLLVQPADQAQRVARVALHVRAGVVATELFASSEDRQREEQRLSRKLAQVQAELTRLAADRQADPAFVASKRAEAERLGASRAQLSVPAEAPRGSYAVAELLGVRRRIARDPRLAGAMKALDARVGESNRRLAEKVPPPAAAPGEPRYVGTSDCEDCHKKQVAQWRGTVHAKAWEELVVVDKQWSYDCISCHVTGYGRAGGSSMAHVDELKDVQCETCHGPGSLHSDDPKKVHLRNPTEADCKQCHTPEHSDTFQFTAYLRDIVGPGHGEKRRAALGAGPTGHDLRHSAIEKARGL